MSHEDFRELVDELSTIKCTCNYRTRRDKAIGKIKKLYLLNELEEPERSFVEKLTFEYYEEKDYNVDKIDIEYDFLLRLGENNFLVLGVFYCIEIYDGPSASHMSQLKFLDSDINFFDIMNFYEWLNGEEAEYYETKTELILEILRNITGLNYTEDQFRQLIKKIILSVNENLYIKTE